MGKNRFIKSEKRFNIKIVIQLMFLVVVIVFITSFASYLRGDNKKQAKESLENLIVKSVTHCYATQGFYPESLEYLQDNYGIEYNKDQFKVVYIADASNIYPQITIIAK